MKALCRPDNLDVARHDPNIFAAMDLEGADVIVPGAGALLSGAYAERISHG